MIKALPFKFKPITRDKLSYLIMILWGGVFLIISITTIRKGFSLPMFALMVGAVINILFLLRSQRDRRIFRNPYESNDGQYNPPPGKEGWED